MSVVIEETSQTQMTPYVIAKGKEALIETTAVNASPCRREFTYKFSSVEAV